VYAPFSSLAHGVGHDEDSLSSMRGTHVACAKSRPLRIVPELGKVSENSACSPSKESCDIFNDHVLRSKLANDSSKLEPQSAPRALEPGAFAGHADILTGESAADEIDGSESCRAGAGDIDDGSIGVGPVLREDASRKIVDLDLPDDVTQSGPFEAELESAHAGEE
jgi:hypothetical protein